MAALSLVICFSDVSLEFRSVQFRHFIIPDGRLDLQSGAQDKKTNHTNNTHKHASTKQRSIRFSVDLVSQ